MMLYTFREQLDDDDIGPILRAKEQDTRPGWVDVSDQSRELKILWTQWDSLHIDQGHLYCVWKSENGQNERLQIVVPSSSIPRISHSIHDRISGVHLRVTKTVSKLRERF